MSSSESLKDEEIVRLALLKAFPNLQELKVYGYNTINKIEADEHYITMSIVLKTQDDEYEGDINTFIFAHDFAKAFWGEEWKDIEQVVNESANFTSLKRWQYHLQQMVLKENPLKYLEKFL